MKIRALSGVLGLGLLLASAPAAGNGRFPAAQLVLTDPSDPDRLWVRATHGVLTSADGGCTWHLLCEAALGYRGTEDPMLGVMADGTVIAAIFDGMATSHDHGCGWSLEGPMKGMNVVDLSVDKSNPARAVAITSNGDGAGGFVNRVFRSADSARTWVQLGPQLAQDLLPFTIDTAPSDPRRIYVSTHVFAADGGGARDGVLLRSDDDGRTWSTVPIGPVASGMEPYLAAIHPTNPDKLYIRLRDRTTTFTVKNRLIYSADAGTTWQELFVRPADMLGFALSPDGSRIVIGLGDSRSLGGERPVDPTVLGIYSASTADHLFTRRREGQVGCMSWTERGLYFCGATFGPDPANSFELGLSNDEGVTATKVMQLAGVEGMLSCPAESQTNRVCEPQTEWPRICGNIGRCDPSTGEIVNAPRGDGCPGGGGSNPGAGGSGPGGSAPDAGAGSPGAEPGSLRIDDGCSVSRSEASRHVAWLGLLGLATLGAAQVVRRQRRRKR